MDRASDPECSFHERIFLEAEPADGDGDGLSEDAARRSTDELWDEVAGLVLRGQRFLLASHVSPDGDAIGGMLAAASLLRGLGKDATLYNADPVPEVLRYLPGAEQVGQQIPEDACFELTLVLDCGQAALLGPGFPDRRVTGPVVVLDHHPVAGEFGDFCLRDPRAAAVGVLVHRLFRRLGAPLCRDAADALWCSILTDTGSFRYASTNPEALRIAAELLEAGVDPWHHASQLYESVPAAQLALLARVLGTLRLSADGRCAALVATEEMIREAGATAEMLDGFVNYGRQVAGIELALLARPGNDGLARVSLRSRGRANVAELARRFGGGGHYAAAGLKLALPPQQAAERVLREAEALLAAGALERAAGGEGCGPGGGNRVGDSEGRGKHGEGHGAEGRG